eukprot:247405_1
MDELPPLKLDINVVSNPTKSYRHSTSIIGKKSTTTNTNIRGVFCKSDNNLNNILDRGRSRKVGSNNNNNNTNDDLDLKQKDKKRTRSLSITRKKNDKSWMTHKDEDNSSERIKKSTTTN